MAAIVTGLIPILRTAVDATSTYKCRTVWFGFLCIRLVVLFLAELSFTKLDADFTCNGTNSLCARACFNRHFDKPMMSAWNFLFVLVVISVLLMELFTSHLRSLALKRKEKVQEVDMEARGKEDEGASVSTDPKGRTMINLHRSKGTVGFYLLSIFLRILVETWFVYTLLAWNLPALRDKEFNCFTNICSELHVCVVRAAPEKRMSIYALASFSGMIIVVSVFFCMYSVAHYIFNF